MKIGFISPRNNEFWGGNEELWYQTALEAARQGHEVVVSLCDFSQNEHRLKALKDAGIIYHLRPRPKRLKNKLIKGIYHRWLKMRRNLSNPFMPIVKFSPDVVFIGQAGTFDFFNNRYLLDIADAGFPLVLNSQYLAEHVVLTKAEIIRIRKLTDRISLFVFVSERNRTSFERMICKKLDHSIVIQNPVKHKTKSIVPLPESIKITFAMVGRLVCSDKGQDIALEVLNSPQWKSRDWQLNIYGRGQDEYYLRSLVTMYGLEDRVNFMGFEADILKLWQENHVLLMPSFAEGSPLALLEAICCGRPSVATDVGGNAMYIREGVTGFLAEAPTTLSFGRAMERFWGRKNSLEDLAENTISFARENVQLHPEKQLLNEILSVVK